MILFNALVNYSRLQASVLRLLVPVLLVGSICASSSLCNAQEVDVWVGTSGKEGIYHLKLDTKNGKLSKPKNVSTIASAGFLALHPTQAILYSSGREDGKHGIAAFSIETSEAAPAQPGDRNAKPRPANVELTPLGFVETGGGGATCLSVDKTGKVAMSAQYGGGTVSTYQLEADGSIKRLVAAIDHGPGSNVIQKRQKASHPHWVGTSPDNRFMMVPDLGKDCTVVYELDLETGEATKHSEVPGPPGGGPRHMKFHPFGKYAYVLNELSMTVSVFGYDESDAIFTPLQEIEALTDELKGDQFNSAAEIRIHPSGKFLYTSNRGHDSITVFAVDLESGELSLVHREAIRGAWPRNFNIDPSGKWLLAAGQQTNTLSLFSIDQETGRLTYSRKSVNIPVPICVEFGSQ